ncbi:MAG: RDD family protein [Ignavibacteriales bacterium]|nr:RDD family protein [Ignavibacteriales bacterium]
MLFGLIFKLDYVFYQNFMSFLLLIVIISYMLLGELVLKNTLGKYLLGIEIVDNERLERPFLPSSIKRGLLKIIFPVEGLVLLLSKSKKRLGDFWGKTIVINKETNKLRSSARLIIGIVVLIALVFSFRLSMGFAVRKADFYNVGINYLKSKYEVEIVGLPKVVNQNRNTVNFIVPISKENKDKYAIIYLDKDRDGWSVNNIKFTKENIIGFSYGLSYSSSKR